MRKLIWGGPTKTYDVCGHWYEWSVLSIVVAKELGIIDQEWSVWWYNPSVGSRVLMLNPCVLEEPSPVHSKVLSIIYLKSRGLPQCDWSPIKPKEGWLQMSSSISVNRAWVEFQQKGLDDLICTPGMTGSSRGLIPHERLRERVSDECATFHWAEALGGELSTL